MLGTKLRRQLKDDAVPTIFKHLSSPKKRIFSAKRESRKQTSQIVNSLTTESPQLPVTCEMYANDDTTIEANSCDASTQAYTSSINVGTQTETVCSCSCYNIENPHCMSVKLDHPYSSDTFSSTKRRNNAGNSPIFVPTPLQCTNDTDIEIDPLVQDLSFMVDGEEFPTHTNAVCEITARLHNAIEDVGCENSPHVHYGQI
ncbi:uncharacterized protein [Ptychodera flava]|uniref:uncharacterized protein n=1 Tax=Ptychodera flava TaxID=63121 RepID=UPI00396A3834